MDTKLAYSLVAFVHDRAASINDSQKLPVLSFADGKKLLELLLDKNIDTPKNLNLDLSDIFDLLDFTLLLNDKHPIERIFDTLVLKPVDVIRRLVEADNPREVKGVLDDFFKKDIPTTAQAFLGTIKPLLQRQVGIALSFVTTLKNLGDPQAWTDVGTAHTQYFFGDTGFVTVDGIPILPPMHFGAKDVFDPSTLQVNLDNLKGLMTEKSADRYLRDGIRVTVEAANDARYDNLRSRFAKIPQHVGLANTAKTVRWFKGISSLAESLVTSAVEEACLGVAQFQTSALVAAAAGTYAGTAARKAAQHVFLRELGL